MKEAYYFSHDSNARLDMKMLSIRFKYGAKGYGIYFMIIEMLRDANAYRLQCDYNLIAYDIKESSEDIKDIIENYNLFIVDNGYFYSQSLTDRMKIREEKSIKASTSAKLRWSNTNAMRTQCEGNALKERKGKEKKGKEKKEDNKNNKQKQGDDFLKIPEWINPEIWKAYLEMRTLIKKPLKTKHQIKLAISTLEKLKSQGHNPNDVINQSVLNSWAGLFALKINRQEETPDKRIPPETETLKAINKKLQGWNSEVETRWR